MHKSILVSIQYLVQYSINLLHYNYNHFTAQDFVWDNQGEPVPKVTFIHSHLSWSSIIPYLLQTSTTIYGILPVQFTCLTLFLHNLQVFFGPPLGLAPSTSYSMHFFTQSSSSFCSTCSYHHNLFCCNTEIMSSNPSLSSKTWHAERPDTRSPRSTSSG